MQTSSDLEVGLKYLTSKQNGWIPQAALMVEVFTPTGYGPSAIRTIAPEIDYIFGWTLNSNWSIGGSTGAIFGQPGAAGVTQYYQSAVIERTSTDQHVQTFAEIFSLFGSGTSQGAVQPRRRLRRAVANHPQLPARLARRHGSEPRNRAPVHRRRNLPLLAGRKAPSASCHCQRRSKHDQPDHQPAGVVADIAAVQSH